MKAIYFFAILVFGISISMNCYAQEEQKKESYKSLKSRSSRSSIEQLLTDANSLKSTNPSQALNNVQEALAMSIAKNDHFNEGKCYLLLGEINFNIKEYALTLDNYGKAYQFLYNYQNTKEYLQNLKGLGDTYLQLNNFQQALRYYNDIQNSAISDDEKEEYKLSIAEVYYQMKNYTEAITVLDGINLKGKEASDLNIQVQNLKARIYARMNEVDKANDYYQSSQRSLKPSANAPAKKENEVALNYAKEEISGALKEQKRYDEDIDLRNQSIDYNLEANNLDEVSKDKIELSKSLAAKGETNLAIRELEDAAIIADTINNPKDQSAAYLNLAELYEKNGNISKALSTFKKYSNAVKQTEVQNELTLQEKADLIKKQKEIEELSSEVVIGQQEEQTAIQRQRLIIYGLLILIGVVVITSYFIYKNAVASKKANQLLALKSLRSQMNPHFIFNALNSVNQFISLNDERAANKFLSEFSRLMRLVLENSQEDFIPLYKEEEIISLYVKLEHYRFRDKFDYELIIDDNINKENLQLPPMLIQPYIENAVWHGLRYMEEKGKLSIHFEKAGEGVKIEITDNGIGRKKSSELKTENQRKHNSTGITNIEERLKILNDVYKTNYKVEVKDLTPESGTHVTILLPGQTINK
jgi:tetratricopeptide (TPR) repeat protein